MSTYEGIISLPVSVEINTDGLPAVDRYRFAKWRVTLGFESSEVVAAEHASDMVAGVIASMPRIICSSCKVRNVPMAVPDGSIPLVELGEAVTHLGTPLRPGLGGRAFLADASGDRRVAAPLELGVPGQVIRCQLLSGTGELVP